MDLVKVGKLIAKLRKEKHMTQEELAYKFDITGKSVSKWERGINAPDIAILEPLSKELGISINELLSGEIDVNKNSKNDKAILDILNYYNKRFKYKSISILIIIVIIFLIAFSLIFTLNNFDKCSVYSIVSNDAVTKIDGLLLFNQKEKIMIINDIAYTSKTENTNNEVLVNSIDLKLVSGKKVIFYLYEDSDFNSQNLSSILNQVSLKVVDKNENEQDILTKEDLNNMYLIIEYKEQNNNRNSIKIKLNFNREFSNNRLFY